MADDDRLILKYQNQASMLANKVLKRYKHLKKRFTKQNLEIFRLYDWDIPEIRAVVDWYAGHLVIGEYSRQQSTPDWLPMMGKAVAQAMDIPGKNLHLKVRQAGFKEGKRYERIRHTNQKLVMQERDLKFYINLNDYVDTGLFSDHRNTRMMVRQMAKGKNFLNLFCYTGSFTCYAAKGGALSSVSVDRAEATIEWATDNLKLNGLMNDTHQLIQQDTGAFLKDAGKRNLRFDLAVVDPPSYSTTRMTGEQFDVAKDHPGMLNAVFDIMRPSSTVFFSTNHQNFTLKTGSLNVSGIREITDKTIPEDYVSKRKQIHRCWEIIV